MIKRRARIFMTLVVPLTLVAVTVFMVLMLSARSSRRTRELTDEILQTIGTQQRDLLDAKLSGEFSVLDVIAGVVESAEARHSEQMLEHIKAVTETSDFVDIYILERDGSGFTIRDEEVYFGEDAYFLQALEGEQTIAHLEESRAGTYGDCFVLMVPIPTRDGIAGVVSGVLSASGINELLRIKNYTGSETFICDSAGHVIAGSESLNQWVLNEDLLDVFTSAVFDAPFSALDTIKDVHAQQEGFVSYTIDDAHWYLSFVPIGINDWAICTAIPGEMVDDALREETSNGYLMIAVAMTCAALLILFVIVIYTGANRHMRREREQLLIAREEYRISARQSGAMILRYDIRRHRLIPNEIMTERYGLQKDAQYSDDSIFLDGMVAEESVAEYKALWASIRNGEPNGRIECRMKRPDGDYGWYSFEFSAIHGEKGNSLQAIVTLRDVTQQHEKAASYERWRSMMSALIGTSLAYMEVNLTTGECETTEGAFQTRRQAETDDADSILLAFEQSAVDTGDRLKFRTFFDRERLGILFQGGVLKDSCEMRLLKEDGTSGLCEITVQMLGYPNTGDVKAVIAITDLGDGASNLERLSDLAFRDDLSGLLNRTAARAAIEETLRFGESEIIALFMLDIDNFKQVNDTLGHQTGDEALVRISETIQTMFRATDVIARIGGDEFFIFLPDATSLGIVQTKAEALCDALRFTFSNGLQSASVSSSIGVIVAKRDQMDYETLYSEADYALYEAKNAGKNRYCIRRQDAASGTEHMRIGGSAYSIQLYALLKHMDGGVTILEAGDSIRPLYTSSGGDCVPCVDVFRESDIHPDDRQYVVSNIRQRAIDGLMLEIAYRSRQSGGEYGWRHLQAIRIPYSGSNLPVLIATITDTTELKRSVALLEPVVAKATTGILIMRFGERMEVTFFNDAFLKIINMNYDQFKLVTRDCASLFRPADAQKLRDNVRSVQADGLPLEFSFLTMNQKNPKLHRVLARGIKIDEQNGVPAYLLILSEEGDMEMKEGPDIRLF